MSESNGKLTLKQAYRRMYALAKSEIRILVLATLFLFIGTGTTLIFPRIAGDVVNIAVEGGLEGVNRAALGLLIVFAIQAVATSFRYYLFSLAGNRIVVDLRARTFRHILDQEIAFFDRRKTGELMSRLASDTTVIQNTVSVNVSMALRGITTGIGGVLMMFLANFQLALVMVLIVPPLSIGAVLFGRVIRKLARESQDELAKAGEVAEEALAGIRVVRAFTKERHEAGRYHKAVYKSLEAIRKQFFFGAVFNGLVTLGGWGVIALLLWYGGRLVVSGTIGPGILVQFMLYAMMVAFALATLASLWSDFMRAVGASERVFDILDRTPEFSNDQGQRPDAVLGRIRFDHVHFHYPSRKDVPALRDVNFVIEPGEAVALVGPSGSGKSTVASLISRFYDPVSGRILLDDHPLDSLDPRWLRGWIGVVPQEPGLFSATIAENIGYGRALDRTSQDEQWDLDEVAAAAKIANAHDFIQAFPEGYQTHIGEKGVQLSGGQKQRIAIARAVLRNPRILILDEATSALDAESEFLVKEAVDRLMQGRTTLIIAHRLSTVRGANRVIVLDAGRVVETGDHETLMARDGGLYRKLVERQFMGDESLQT